jgi:uncharacterized protein (DUF2235 family)
MSEVSATSSATSPSTKPGRNLVICCDGTSNQFGTNNTNVIRLVQVMTRHPEKQRLYYDPGVGTLPQPGVTGKLKSAWSIVKGLAFGAGLSDNVTEAYTYLMNYWERGDRVFLFGFSRGSYTVRVLAGMLHAVGLLPRGSENMVPYAMRLFKAVRKAKDPNSGYWKLLRDFRRTFARPSHDHDDARHFPVHFVGVWDTVSSVGWVWDPAHFAFTAKNPSIATLRHAIALQERRWFFRQNLAFPPDPPCEQDLVQRWFAGSHCDIGGGYPSDNPSDSRIWRNAMEWMVAEAEKAGLLIYEKRRDEVLPAMPSDRPLCCEGPQESLKWYWWPAEFFPKMRGGMPAFGRGRWRRLPDGAQIHRSVLERIRLKNDYAPPNLSPEFLAKVRDPSYAVTDYETHVGEVTSPKVAPGYHAVASSGAMPADRR